MKVTLLLAEAATAHPDGTVSILRAGINRAVNAKAPIPLSASLIARVEGEAHEGGSTHKFSVRLLDEDGHDVLPKVEGGFQLPSELGAVNLVMNFQALFPKHGRYSFQMKVDETHHVNWSVEVADRPPGAKA